MSSLDSVNDDDALEVLVGRVVISILQTAEQEAERIVDHVTRSPEPVSVEQVAALARECLEADDRCRSATQRLRATIENGIGPAVGISQTRPSADEASNRPRAVASATGFRGSVDSLGRSDQSAQSHVRHEQVGSAPEVRVDDQVETHTYRPIHIDEPSSPSTIDTTQADAQPSVELETAAQPTEADAYVQVEPAEDSIQAGRRQATAPAHARSKDRTGAWSFVPEIVLAALAIVGAIVLLMLFLV